MSHLLCRITAVVFLLLLFVPLCSQAADVPVSESDMLITADTPDVEPDITGSGPSGVMVFVRMILVLAVVIAAIYGVIALLKRISKTPDAESLYIKHISGITIAPGKTVHVITVGSRGFILGAADSSISVIAELDDRELIDSMNLQENVRNPASKRFFDVLSTVVPFNRKKEPDSGDEIVETRLHSLTERVSKNNQDMHQGDV